MRCGTVSWAPEAAGGALPRSWPQRAREQMFWNALCAGVKSLMAVFSSVGLVGCDTCNCFLVYILMYNPELLPGGDFKAASFNWLS